jgi:hypothetical protein
MAPLDDNAALLLEAHRYLSGDMDAGEWERFEERLADDQAVRDALADAVLLEQALSVEHPPVTGTRVSAVTIGHASRGRQFSRRALLACAGSLAALIVIAVAISGRFEAASSPLADASATGPVSDEDALAAELWTSITADGDVSEYLEEPDDPELDQLDIPEWMFAAVEAGKEKRDSLPFEPLDDDDEEETL